MTADESSHVHARVGSEQLERPVGRPVVENHVPLNKLVIVPEKEWQHTRIVPAKRVKMNPLPQASARRSRDDGFGVRRGLSGWCGTVRLCTSESTTESSDQRQALLRHIRQQRLEEGCAFELFRCQRTKDAS